MSQAPVRVSPLIKLARYSFLGAGIFYGIANQSRFAKKEVEVRKIEGEKKAIRDAKLAEERKRRAEEEIRALETLAGTKKK